ncbi:FAD binding domain-containing protein [Colletotrichum orchidophilum]|uniref:L-ornithine N(5)-monooxygenase [NAD(P)H] n=1 Tax=Colletotrichum orchidophilum TaxID=1209926 RepID=A0A1G4ASH1_9PEZI|nr:FAD binding domain-containing protein [Colletotrichum orchidophilum]OHE91982.1 FAD binding domain-containing protein [Colletotrichum orchidophilum]
MTEAFIHDVLIIGAGPCGLAVASRLCEHSPSALFTDEEHQRYHWIRKYGRRMPLKNRRNGNIIEKRTPVRSQRYSTLVLDATGDEWMNRWNRLFKTFDITHLRSPMFFHVDPSDRDALLARAHERNQENELQELRACVGKEISKHLRKARLKSRNPKQHAVVEVDERDRKDYFTPPTNLFANHCECIVDRYGLREGLIQNEKVEDIQYRTIKQVSPDANLFAVHTNKGTHYARTVVLAVGPANAPTIPPVLGLNSSESNCAAAPPQVCHSMQIQKFPDPIVQAKMAAKKTTNVLVVGGGLTSAQLSDLAIRRGVTKVWHLMRGPCKVKPFDIDLAWMGKFRNVEQAYFWSADSDEERLQQIQSARGGGSITPPYQKRLKQHIARGSLRLLTNTRLSEARFDEDKKVWNVKTEPPAAEEGGLPGMDFIYFATGVQTDYSSLPYLQTMLREHPIHGHGGIPCIDDDLKWSKDVPLFVTGRMAALRLGPGSANLAGARAGAERIAWAIEDLLPDRTGDGPGESDMSDEKMRFVTGRGNRFDSLVTAGDGDW